MFKKISFFFIMIIWVLSFFWFATPVKATATPYFKLSASQGQGVGSNEFYVGRCFRVNIYLNTGGLNSNAADMIVDYDDSVLQMVQSNCSTSATQGYAGSLFNNYPSSLNFVTSTASGKRLKISAYNNPGVSYSNSSDAIYAYTYFKVLTASSSYDLDFYFTGVGATLDTNLAESGTSNEILAAVENLNLSLLDDNDNPVIDTQSPSNGATGVAVNSTVSFRLYDAMSGINSGTVTARMKESGGSYYSQSVSVGSSLSTNQTRYYQYTGSISPNSNVKTNGGYYKYNTTYTVEATAYDLTPTSPHSTTSEWSFTTEDDTNAPYITNFSPTDGSSGVAVDSNVSFRIKDYKSNGGVIPGLGVDEDSIAFTLNSTSLGEQSYTCASDEVTCDASNINNILVTLNPASNFGENETVTVAIVASDLHTPTANDMSTSTYSFTTADTVAPVVADFTPVVNSVGNASTTNVSFHITDGGAGVAIETLSVYINDVSYTAVSDQVTVTGDASDYLIDIDPDDNFSDDTAVVVRIAVRDQAPSQNWLSPNPSLYTFIVGLESQTVTVTTTVTTTIETTCPTCPSCGGGGGGIIYVKQECPETPQCEVCEETVCPVVETPVCSEVVESEGGEKIIIKTVTTTVSQPFEDIFVKLKTINQTDSQVISGDEMLFFTPEKLPVSIKLLTINDKVLPAKKFLRFTVREEKFALKGASNMSENGLIPLLIANKKDKDNPLVFHVSAQSDGGFSLAIKNIFSPGEYIIKTLLNNEKGEVEETELGSFAVDDIYVVPLRTESEQQKLENRYNYIYFFIFFLIVMVSLTVLFQTRSLVGSVGFATTFLLAIVGTVGVLTFNKDREAIIISDPVTNTQLQTDDVQSTYQQLLENSQTSYDEFNGQLIDPASGRPLSGVSIEFGNQSVITDETGNFVLSNVLSTDKIKITASGLNTPVYLTVASIEDNKINFNLPLLSALAEIEPAQKQRKFKSVYTFASTDLKQTIDEKLYTSAKTSALLQRLKQIKIADAGFDPNMEILSKWTSDSLQKTFTNVAKVDFVYSGYNDKQGVAQIREPWYFIQEGGEWRFVE